MKEQIASLLPDYLVTALTQNMGLLPIILLITWLVDFVLQRLLARIAVHLEKNQITWDDIVIASARKPLRLLVWVLGLFSVSKLLQIQTGADIDGLLWDSCVIGIMLAIGWFLTQIANRTEQVLSSQAQLESKDKSTIQAISRLLKIAIAVTICLVIMQTLGFSVSGLIAFGGMGGIIIGFAAKDLLANFFGGLMLFLDRPFIEGDWVASPDRKIEGTVEKIGWRLTIIRTFDKRPIYVPNSVFASIVVENPSRMTNRRIYETLGIRYQDSAKMGPIVNDIKAMLQAHPAIDQQQALIVNFDELAPSSLNFFIYTLTKTTDWFEFHEIKQDVLLKALDIITAHQAELAFPTHSILMENNQQMPPFTNQPLPQ